MNKRAYEYYTLFEKCYMKNKKQKVTRFLRSHIYSNNIFS